MWPFRKKGDGAAEPRKAEVDYSVKHSFQRVRSDMDNVNTWLNFLYQRDSEMHQALESMRSQFLHLSSKIDAIPASASVPAEWHSAIARLNDVESRLEHVRLSVSSPAPLLGKISEINSKVSLIEESQKSMKDGVFERLRDLSSRMEKVEQSRTRSGISLREKIIRKVARNSKDYIKGIILSTMGKYDEISALHLREMIVEEQGLCSKSTFYRMLEEIEEEGKADMVSRGKEKIYLAGMHAKH